MRATNSIRVSFSLIALVVVLAFLVGAQPALAQTRPDKGIPDNTGPDADGDQSGEGFQQSGRFVNLTRGLSSLGNIDLELGDPDCTLTPTLCDQPRRHFSVRVPVALTEWTLWIFDGDSRQGPGGGVLK